MKKNHFFTLPLKVFIIACLTYFSGNICFAQDKNLNQLECNKEIARIAVHSLATGFAGIIPNASDDESRAEIFHNFISKIRFYNDSSGYFYVYTMNCVCIAHAAQKELENQNLYDYKDIKGKYVIRELSEAAKKGGGFVEFYWVKPGTKEEVKKIGYVEPIPGTYYFVGTGVYLP